VILRYLSTQQAGVILKCLFYFYFIRLLVTQHPVRTVITLARAFVMRMFRCFSILSAPSWRWNSSARGTLAGL